MLETKKSTTLTGTITVKDGDVDKQVVYFLQTSRLTEQVMIM